MKLTDAERDSLNHLVSLLKRDKPKAPGKPGRPHAATMSTGTAARLLGCKEDKVRQLVNGGLLWGYRLPNGKKGGPIPGLPGVSSRDRRHLRIPTVCVLLTMCREWIDSWGTERMRSSTEATLGMLGPLILHLPLPLLRQLHAVMAARLEDLEQTLREIAPRSAAASPEDHPELPLS